MADIKDRREAMVDYQVAARGVTDERVLDAMRAVPREHFVPDELAEFAYEDTPLPIEAGQTISQPYIVALMLEAAEIQSDDRVLEIGVGSGYSAAMMSRIARRVHAIDRHEQLADLARERMAALGYDNVVIRSGDGTRGWPENATFDVILVAAGGPAIPTPLREQLALSGRLVIPVGAADEQRLMRVTRIGDHSYVEDDLGAVRFVPLIGRHGWGSAERDTTSPDPAQAIRDAAEPLPDIDDPGFAAFIDRFADARATEMDQSRNELNLGQLCREHHGEEARLIGFGTHDGTVAAATDWGGPMEVKPINPSRPGSYEQLCHDTGQERFFLDLREGAKKDARGTLGEARLERFIGVIYRPDTERWSHYSSAILSDQYDGWVWFDRTEAIHPLPMDVKEGGADTFPFGL